MVTEHDYNGELNALKCELLQALININIWMSNDSGIGMMQ
jgi:flagellar biosynthesis regulator FlaF